MAGSSNAPDLTDILGVPVRITSGKRDPLHNALVGGVPNSDHLTDNARDFVPQGMSMADAADRAKKSGKFTKVLNEGDHVHVSYQGQQVAQNVSDDDLLNVMGGGSAKAVTTPKASANVSDADLLGAMGEAPKGSATPAPPPPPPPPAKDPGLLERLNLIAHGKQVPKTYGLGDDFTSKLPFAKDIMSAGASGLDMLGAKLEGKPVPSFSAGYQSHMADLQAQQKQYDTENPRLGRTGDVLSILGGGAPARGVAAVKATLPTLMKQGAKAGATIGGLFGLGHAPTEGPDSIDKRLEQGAMGTVLGGATGGAVPVLGAAAAGAGRVAGNVSNKLFPSVEDIASQKAKGIIESFAGGPVMPNPAELVPGSKPTLAEATGNPGVAALTRAMRDLNPNSPLLAREAQNQEARLAHLETATGTPEDVAAAASARDKAATSTLKQVFGAKSPTVDIAPVKQAISDILDGPSGARSSVKDAMRDVTNTLNNGGKPIADPEKLYHSVRKEIGDLISGTDMTKAYGKAAATQRMAVRDKLDDVIESGAPGFKQYLEDYTASSKPIASMKFLQEQNLLDAKGNITLQKVQNAIRRLDQQQAAAGAKAAKSVTDAQRNALESIRDDLLRSKNIELGRAIGSNSIQNVLAQKRLGLSQYIPEGVGATGGATLGGLIAGPHGAEIGGAVGDRLGAMIGSMRASRNAVAQGMTQSKLEEMLLNPGAYQAPPMANRSQASLNDILNSAQSRALMTGANRLVASPKSRQKNAPR